VTCTNTPGSRTCGPCPEGTTGDGVKCTSMPFIFFYFNGGKKYYLILIWWWGLSFYILFLFILFLKALCGDKICNPEDGENCVTCVADCKSPCGMRKEIESNTKKISEVIYYFYFYFCFVFVFVFFFTLGLCGDNFCAANETCQTCSKDCTCGTFLLLFKNQKTNRSEKYDRENEEI
jgi:hypothetical protein